MEPRPELSRTADPRAIGAWLAHRKLATRSLARLEGGASPRTYWRVQLASPLPDGCATAIVMALPEDTLVPTEHGASREAAELPWLSMARFLATLGLPVPRCYLDDVPAGYLLIEDLGDERLYDRLQAVPPVFRPALYLKALALLGAWQRAVRGHLPAGGVPTFGRAHLLAELQEFADMALEARLGITLSAGERAVLGRVGDTLAQELLLGRQLLAHRDFQSQNLMVTPRGLVLVDFQDAFVAPDVYDLVALLRDSYVVLPAPELEHHLARFALITAQPLEPLRDRFLLQTIQRKMKDSGRFETLARRGKPGFLRFFADSIGYVVSALTTSQRFPDLLDLLRTRLPEARGDR